MEMMRIKNLSFQYKKKPALFSGFNFSGAAGEIILITGPSGNGKSTLASLIAGHLNPVEGEIIINNKIISGPSREVIVVHQENNLFPWLTVKEHLDFLHKVQIESGPARDYHEELEQFGLLSSVNAYPKELSGGMKRRLAILRGVMIKPHILILDESLSSLDNKLKQEIMSILKKYVIKNKLLLILIDHNADSVMSYIDQQIEL
jgi:ABC-type nitrate/sulfonate/bicarbonate transport system ATPase subunit